jgi:hypothetical protein
MEIDKIIERVIRLRIFYDRNLFTESTRGNVIVLCAALEALLKELIEQDTSPKKQAIKHLIKGKEAYNTFFKAINTAQLIGIVNDITAEGIHMLRDLRNDLAHGVTLLSADKEVSSRLQAISDKLEAVPNDEPQWCLHGVSIKLLHGIIYNYAEENGLSRDYITSIWEPIRQKIINEK